MLRSLIIPITQSNDTQVVESLQSYVIVGANGSGKSHLGAWIEKNDISMLKNTDETMEVARKGALSMDMKPYYLYRQKNMAGNFENVGYATEGKYGIYNILIMEEKQTIVALGAGSITKRVFPDGRIERCDNIKDVAGYMERIDEMIERKKELFKEF